MRVVRDPAGAVALDPTGKAPGRGAYVCDDPACQQTSIDRGALRRALAVPIPAGLFGPPGPGAQPDHTTREGGS